MAAVNAAGLSAFSEESNGVTTKAVSERESPLPVNYRAEMLCFANLCMCAAGERMAAVVGFGGTLTVASSQEYSDLVRET